MLSHRYVIKLHRHTSQVNDEMRTHEWPQFVQDVVEHDDIDFMKEYICICFKNSLQQKKCLTRHVQMVCSYLTPHRIYKTQCQSDFSMNSIHDNTHHEMIWWPLQSKWSTCQCSSNTRSNYRHIASQAQ